MKQLTLPSDAHQSGRTFRALTRSVIAFSCLIAPSLARAQSYSPGDLATTPLTSLGAPATGNAPPFQFGGNADLSERYITNALGTPSPTKSDFDSRAAVSLNASEQSSGANASLAYTGSVDYFARDPSRPIFSNYLFAKGTFSVLPEHILFSAQVFAQPEYESELGNVAPIGEVLPPNAKDDFINTYGFAVQPDLFFRLGDFLRSDLIPAYSGVFIDQPTAATAVTLPADASVAQSEYTQSLTEKITSGSDFTRLQWGAIANYTAVGQSGSGLIQRSATGQVSYAITQGVAVVGSGGYQSVTAGALLIKPSSGPVIMGGVNFDLPTLTGQILVGEQYRSFSAVGHINYQITPRISLVAAATDSVTTPLGSLTDQSTLLQSVVTALASGQVQLSPSGILTNSQIYNIGLENEIDRIRVGTLTFQYSLDNFSATLTGFGTQEDALTAVAQGQNTNLQSLGVSPSVQYTLSPDASIGADFYYIDQTQSVGSNDDIQFDVNGTYKFSDRISFYLQGTYFERLSSNSLAALSTDSGNVYSTSVQLGIRYQW